MNFISQVHAVDGHLIDENIVSKETVDLIVGVSRRDGHRVEYADGITKITMRSKHTLTYTLIEN